MGMGQVFSKIRDYFGNTCYYPGCLTRFALPEIEKNYIEIIEKLDIDFIMIPEEMMCCGAPVLNAGYCEEFVDHKGRLVGYFKKHGVSKVITSCPTCYGMLKKKYDYNVQHFTQVMHKHIKKLKKISDGEKITYHDPCHLGRYEGIYDEPREILKAMGFEVVEMKDNREKSLCCGGGAGLRNTNQKTASKIAKIRNRQAIEAGTSKLVTCCPMCYSQLKENAPPGLEVYELSELIIKAL